MKEKQIITRKLINALKTERGGWTRETLEALGVAWPPRQGWIDRIVGKPVMPLPNDYVKMGSLGKVGKIGDAGKIG